MAYFDYFLHTYTCQHSLITGMQNHILIDKGLLSISPAVYGQLVKMPIILEPYGIFGSILHAYLYCPATSMQNGNKASPSIF